MRGRIARVFFEDRAEISVFRKPDAFRHFIGQVAGLPQQDLGMLDPDFIQIIRKTDSHFLLELRAEIVARAVDDIRQIIHGNRPGIVQVDIIYCHEGLDAEAVISLDLRDGAVIEEKLVMLEDSLVILIESLIFGAQCDFHFMELFLFLPQIPGNPFDLDFRNRFLHGFHQFICINRLQKIIHRPEPQGLFRIVKFIVAA